MSRPERIGRYEIVDRVGRGGMGVLYRAKDPRFDREVAIKVLSSDLDIDDTTRSRFVREGLEAARLLHRNIVTVYEFAEDEGTPYIVMEFLKGKSLAARLTETPPLTIAEALDTVIQLCTGLDFAHEHGIVHRDVKPANVWLQDEGTVKLLDFGIARVAASALTRHGEVVGSAAYIAPEQVRGLPVDGRADVFSAGIVLYELLAGRRPFEAESPTAIINLLLDSKPAPIDDLPGAIPAAVRSALARALQKNVEDRYAMASEFSADLHIAALELGFNTDTLVEDPSVAGSATIVVLEDAERTVFVPPPVTATLAMPASATPALDLPLHRSPTRDLSPAARRSIGRRNRMTVTAVAAFSLVTVAVIAWLGGARAPTDPPPEQPSVGKAPETPPPPAPAATEIEIDSVPSRAAIWRKGTNTGLRTPAKVAISDIRSGAIRLMLAGYTPFEVQPSDAPEGVARALIKLRAVETPVQVTVRGPYPFEVVTPQRTMTVSDVHHLTVSGRQTIRLRSSQFFLNETLQIDPRNGGRQAFSAPGLGTLEVRTVPGLASCMVSIQDREIDYPTVKVAAAAGQYSIRLVKCPDGRLRQQRGTVRAGMLERVTFQ